MNWQNLGNDRKGKNLTCSDLPEVVYKPHTKLAPHSHHAKATAVIIWQIMTVIIMTCALMWG